MRNVKLTIVGLALAACHPQQGQQTVDAEGEPPTAAAATDAAEPDGTKNDMATANRAEELPPVSPCLVQGKERLQVTAIRAVGTEPFWGARVEGRCITYSTPDDQEGVRIWTRYSEASGTAQWIGQLNGKPFRMRIRAEPGCSDGMSDNRYPIAVELTAGGEQRRGCAEPL